jgi:hypothetical protein
VVRVYLRRVDLSVKTSSVNDMPIARSRPVSNGASVAAQMVHFCAVIALHTKFAAEPLQLGGPEIAITLVGFSIVLGVGITAPLRLQPHILYRAVHRVLLYMIWLILAADYTKHPIKSLRLVATLVVIALVLRHLPRRHTTKPDSNLPASAFQSESKY